jgi:hypothetical protein
VEFCATSTRGSQRGETCYTSGVLSSEQIAQAFALLNAELARANERAEIATTIVSAAPALERALGPSMQLVLGLGELFVDPVYERFERHRACTRGGHRLNGLRREVR